MQKFKDKKIRIITYTSIQDEYGFPENTYKPLHPGKLWAYYRHMSAREFYAAMSMQAEEEVIFVINWRDDITTSMYIEYDGKYYDINRIDNFEGYKSDITIYAKYNPSLDIVVEE